MTEVVTRTEAVSHHRRLRLSRNQPDSLSAGTRAQRALAGSGRVRLLRLQRPRRCHRGRHPRRSDHGPGVRGHRHRGALRGRAPAVLAGRHPNDRHRWHSARPRGRREARRRARRDDFVDGGVRHSGSPSALRGRPAHRRRPLRRGEDRRRGSVPRVSCQGFVHPHHQAEELRGAGASRRVRPVLRLGAHGARIPDDREREQPLPAPRRRRPVRCHLPVLRTGVLGRRRHVQCRCR